ncbi:hypothetical protein AMTRI_Chr09g38240 [Amborella trichopoda]
MFEGLVRQLLAGYGLGRYFKDIQKELQFKIELGKGKASLDNVALIPEAFDYLQLPFSIKEGRIGNLSIQIPWKKLGWDPIVIELKDVFLSTCPRDDAEYAQDAVEKRDIASKRAKLAAAELAKLSRRVSNNQVGQSFLSYLSAKILDNIQVTIYNFHVIYDNKEKDLMAHFISGLKFSRLDIMTDTGAKQNRNGNVDVKFKGTQVNKVVKILDMGIYWNSYEGYPDRDVMNISETSQDIGRYDYLIKPFNVTIWLVVDKSGKFEEGTPTYTVKSELTRLVLTLNEIQLQQILFFGDEFSIHSLREKYGRHRPWGCPLSEKQDGWQRLWWWYAQESVLLDVRRKLRKNSWSHLGERIILQELERMEKAFDIDEILTYRSIAESQLQEFLLSSTNPSVESTGTGEAKQHSDERPSSQPRGWLNWLSLGMLGAGDPADSGQFSGVVSDETIKVLGLLEANNDSLRMMAYGVILECKIWSKSASVSSLINQLQIVDPATTNIWLASLNSKNLKQGQPFISVQVELLPQKCPHDISVKVVLQPFEAFCDSKLLLSLLYFHSILGSFQSHDHMVLSSLDGFENVKVRLLTKAEYVLLNRAKVAWDVKLGNATVAIPCSCCAINTHKMILSFVGLHLQSIPVEEGDELTQKGDQNYDYTRLHFHQFFNQEDISTILYDFYDRFQIRITDFEGTVVGSDSSQEVTIVDRFNALITVGSCIFGDESALKQLEVCSIVQSLGLHFSSIVNEALIGLVNGFTLQKSDGGDMERYESASGQTCDASWISGREPHASSKVFQYSATVQFNLVTLHVNLEDEDAENNLIMACSLEDLDFQCSLEEFVEEYRISIRMLSAKVINTKGESVNSIICTNKINSASFVELQGAEEVDCGFVKERNSEALLCAPAEACFVLQYQAGSNVNNFVHKITLGINDIDFHCHPRIVALLLMNYERLCHQCIPSSSCDSVATCLVEEKEILHPRSMSGIAHKKFGFSNFCITDSHESAPIPLDQFPFVTIHNSGSLDSLEESLIFGVSEWRKLFPVKNRQSTSARHEKLATWRTSWLVNNSRMRRRCSVVSNGNSGSFNEFVQFVVDLDLYGVKLHFHDLSCIMASLGIPALRSSLYIRQVDCWDIISSFNGLNLTSSWFMPDKCELLWGPSLPYIAPVLNVRIRKGMHSMASSQIEISLGIQHINCTLPSDFLAVVIGYFSSSDWKPSMKKQFPNMEDDKTTNFGKESCCFLYKFEVLDSSLSLPLGSNSHQFIEIGIQQLYCSFVPKGLALDALKRVPSECAISINEASEVAHLLNIFGRGVSVSFSLLNGIGQHSQRLDQDQDIKIMPLVEALHADMWIRIPCESECFGELSTVPTCIMVMVETCQLIATEEYFLWGLEAAMAVIDEMSSVGMLSKLFTSDVLRFMQLKNVRHTNAMVQDGSSVGYTKVRICMNTMSVRLQRLKDKHLLYSKVVAQAETRLTVSAMFRNGIPIGLDMKFINLVLYSMCSNDVLFSFASVDSVSASPEIHFSKSDKDEDELFIVIPSVDVWLLLEAWDEVFEFISSCTRLNRPSETIMSSESLNIEPLDERKCSGMSQSQTKGVGSDNQPRLSVHSAEDGMHPSGAFTVNVENNCIFLHFPIHAMNDPVDSHRCAKNEHDMHQGFTYVVSERKQGFISCGPGLCKSMTLSLYSCHSEIVLSGNHMKLKLKCEKAEGNLEMIGAESIHSLPFSRLFNVNLTMEISKTLQDLMQVFTVIQTDTLDLWISYQILNFFHGIGLRLPSKSSFQAPQFTMAIKVILRKGSFLLSDGRWNCNLPIMEIFLKNILVDSNQIEDRVETLLTGDLQVNYNNIQKVMWEPFLEPWSLNLKLIKACEQSALLNRDVGTDIHLLSSTKLNVNITEALLEACLRGSEIIKDAFCLLRENGKSESSEIDNSRTTVSINGDRYAPYILQNDTSLPLSFWVLGLANAEDVSISDTRVNIVEPGSSVPLYIDETPEDQFFRHKPSHSSEKLNGNKLDGVQHHMICVQLEGTSRASIPMSMDLVGLRYFEVDFSKFPDITDTDKNGDPYMYSKQTEDNIKADSGVAFVVPVVFEVSIQRYSKLIRLYSTVVLLNATSVPLELRFDIPFGISPKVLDPILPGQELPLPVHLAEAGRMRWRPLDSNYLWSEAHPLANILSQESRLGFLRSFVCYPSHPSNDPFRCSISVQDIPLTLYNGTKRSSIPRRSQKNFKCLNERSDQRIHSANESKKRFIRQVRLTTPLILENCLPMPLHATIESSGGVVSSVHILEVDTASLFHIDSTHDLGITFHLSGFGPSLSKFLRAETFTAMGKTNASKFPAYETLRFHPDETNGDPPICLILEKTMDAFSGARRISISVPFWLYNCTGLNLTLADGDNENKGHEYFIPSSYSLVSDEQFLAGKVGLSIVSAEVSAASQRTGNFRNIYPKKSSMPCKARYLVHLAHGCGHLGMHDTVSQQASFPNIQNKQRNPARRSENNFIVDDDSRKLKACMYSPVGGFPSSELMVRLSACVPDCFNSSSRNILWSNPFSLVPANGSNSLVIPQPGKSGAFILSVASMPFSGVLNGRTRAIIFQPRYVISNACRRDLCFKQKGSDLYSRLGVGEHCQLHWTDTSRELLVSVRFDEPGWQWSGSFLPDRLGDIQVKMHNYVTGALNMVRVEVQNTDFSIQDKRLFYSSNGNSGTYLILLSDDDTGFMPYRIDNFSMTRLRIYQQNCEIFERTVHSYSSCPYAWDEPCYPHRLVVEVPGECVLGSYILDDVREFVPAFLPSTYEKPERRFFLSVHAEGAVKVFSIINSNLHFMEDVRESGFYGLRERRKISPKQENAVYFNEKISIRLPFIGISVIDSAPQELLFACAKDIKIDILQSLDRQELSFQISLLQIDNQLRNTPYPVILSFDHDLRGMLALQVKNKKNCNGNERTPSGAFDSSPEAVFDLAVAKWRNKDLSLVSFEYINLRLAPMHVELEEQVLFNLLDLFRAMTLRIQSRSFQEPKFELLTMGNGTNNSKKKFAHFQNYEFVKNQKSGHLHFLKIHKFMECRTIKSSLAPVVPIGAPGQQIFLLARRQKKLYIELFHVAPIMLTVSFSSTPWIAKDESHVSAESMINAGGSVFQRWLMALVDVDGAPVYLKQITMAHHLASMESMQEILIRHYTRQLLQEMYKVFGSAGVIGNPIGFIRNVGLGIKDFVLVPARGVLQSPTELVVGMVHGTKSLFINTVYAMSNAATLFSKAARMGVVAFAFDEQAVAEMEKRRKHQGSHSKGVLNEFLEGLTGLLQSPIRGAEKHGLPGILSGVAAGTAGFVARPVVSILEVAGRTAQSIRNRTQPQKLSRFRVRFPRPLAFDLPLLPYSWEEAVGISMLLEADESRLRNETFVTCKALKQAGGFVVVTERVLLTVKCATLAAMELGDHHVGVHDAEWTINLEMALERVIHIDVQGEVLNVLAYKQEWVMGKRRGSRIGQWSPLGMPLVHESVELSEEVAALEVLHVLWSMIERGKHRAWGACVVQQNMMR